jgi:hypothetical protein
LLPPKEEGAEVRPVRFEPTTRGFEAPRFSGKQPKIARRDGAVTACAEALRGAAAREPQALARCVEALGLALGVMLACEEADQVG